MARCRLKAWGYLGNGKGIGSAPPVKGLLSFHGLQVIRPACWGGARKCAARWLEWLGTGRCNLGYAGSIPVLASGAALLRHGAAPTFYNL
jgi:hypothetical protein